MPIAYDDSSLATEVAERTREFVDSEVIPVERDVLGSGPIAPDRLDDLRDRAREYGVYGPQLPESYGGLDLDFRDMLPVFEAAGRSLLGGPALNVQAPDEGNMHTLMLVGTEAQKERWLGPLARGEIKSSISMTEPAPGSGSDPKMMRTTARKEGDEWVINGHKWWTTQGSDADLLIVMARTDMDAHPYAGTSMFLVPADTDGVDVVRDIPHVGNSLTGMVHSEIKYDEVRIPEANLLGPENEGFTVAQQRLGPARLTHCMRFSGMAERALDVAKAYVSEREAFGSSVADKQSVRFAVADAETKLHAARSMVRHAADRIAAGEQARVPVSMCKVYAANAVQETIDLAVQCCGASGLGRDLPLADFYEEVRQFRIVDGADEVHKRVIARDAFDEERIDPDQLANLPRYDG